MICLSLMALMNHLRIFNEMTLSYLRFGPSVTILINEKEIILLKPTNSPTYVDTFYFEHAFQVHTRTLTTRSQARKQDVNETPCRF